MYKLTKHSSKEFGESPLDESALSFAQFCDGKCSHYVPFNNHHEDFPMRFTGNRKKIHIRRLFQSFRGSASKKNPSFSAFWTFSPNDSSVQLISKPRDVYKCTFSCSCFIKISSSLLPP